MTKVPGMIRGQPLWFWLILALAVALRVWIASYNTEANDPHLEVIHKIMATGESPVVDDCWQCYHVKAFHYPAAVMLARLNVSNPLDQIHLLQYGNVLLGVFTILLLWAWLSRQSMDESWKLALFALFALNPRVAAISTQVTNDSLVIFAATACLFFYARFLDSRKFRNLFCAVLLCGLSAAAKASGIVVGILLFGHLFLLAVTHRKRLPAYRVQATFAVLLTVGVVALVPYAGYMQNYQRTGDLLANNVEKYPFPNWSEEKRWSQAGAINVVDSYLAFAWPGLVSYPYITKGPAFYPEHRTNHWAQLYGRHSFSRFTRWPPSWETNGYWITWLGRAAMVLGLVPLLLLVAGVGSFFIDAAGRLGRSFSVRPLVRDSGIFLGLAAVAMLAMSLKLSLDFQTYRIMKAIYVYPGLLGFLALVAWGVFAMRRRVGKGVTGLVYKLLLSLIVVHVVDLVVLAADIQARYPEQVHKVADFRKTGPLGPREVRLNRITPANLAEAAARVRINRSFPGRALTGGYDKYEHGFGTQATSVLVFDLDERYSRFRTAMALADEAHSSDGVRFEIRGDGRLLYQGPRMLDHQVEHARVDVSKVDKLTLKVIPLGTSYGDFANWLDPVLTRKKQGTDSNIDNLLQ